MTDKALTYQLHNKLCHVTGVQCMAFILNIDKHIIGKIEWSTIVMMPHLTLCHSIIIVTTPTTLALLQNALATLQICMVIKDFCLNYHYFCNKASSHHEGEDEEIDVILAQKEPRHDKKVVRYCIWDIFCLPMYLLGQQLCSVPFVFDFFHLTE